MGFVPLAFRAGSARKARVHIFWQRRIREGDTTTPWWFPSKTSAGAMGEDRIVLPIPPGTHWSDAKPLILPTAHEQEKKQLAGSSNRKTQIGTRKLRGPDPTKGPVKTCPGQFRPRGKGAPAPEPEKVEKPRREKKPKLKNDPAHVAAARELRDRWLEKVNSGQYVFEAAARYEVARALPSEQERTIRMLPAA